MIIKNAKIFDGEKFIEENAVITEGKLIKKVLKASELTQDEINGNEVIDINGMVLSPGFIDLQINGCGGVLFNDDISVENNRFPLVVHEYSLLKHHQGVSLMSKKSNSIFLARLKLESNLSSFLKWCL